MNTPPLVAKILIAASPKPREIVERILDGHDLSSAETIREAEQLLRKRSFDLIVCTIMFDESRMFDFLRLVKLKKEWRQIPFVCARAKNQILRSPVALEAVDFTSRALGAAAFLNISDYRWDPEREMRGEIEAVLRRHRG